MSLDFDTRFEPAYGEAVAIAKGVARLTVNNPSPFTFHGTNSYILGTDTLAVIDPGPDDDAHLEALIRAIAGRPVSHIFVSHTHRDHSPLAARLKGLSLGLATMALTFTGVWLLYSLDDLTGGYNGRNVPALEFGPLSSVGSNIAIGGMQITSQRFVWYAGLIALLLVVLFTHNILGRRIGRALTAVRDADVHAGALGVNIGEVRAITFVISSAFAGLAGVLIAINIQRVVPDYWGLHLSLSYLAMIVIGGMRSIGGATLGALIVTALPSVLQRYGQSIPGVGSEGGDGLSPAVAAQVLYGAFLVLVLLVQPQGLVRLGKDGYQWVKDRLFKNDSKQVASTPAETSR